MSTSTSLDRGNRRLAAYSYLRGIVAGRRVLEVGSGDGRGAEHLLSLGATQVTSVDADASALDQARRRVRRPEITFVNASATSTIEAARPFDVVVVPDAAAFLEARASLGLTAVRALLATDGHLVCVVPNGDRAGARDGVGYYDLQDALAPQFSRVRMFGQTPFLAYGLAEFDGAATGLRIDAALVESVGEEPSHYLAVAGPDEEIDFGYALVQVPFSPERGEAPRAERVATERTGVERDEVVSDLRRRLADAEGRAEGATRSVRAQTEEMEELRARLRRAAEDRAGLDDEMGRLRRALSEADESVLNLTRRTTEEISALAQQLTSGLRVREGADGRDGAAAELRNRDAELAARASALSERDERVAALEADRQDLLWRIESVEDELAQARARVIELEVRAAETPAALAQTAGQWEPEVAFEQPQVMTEYRRAAAAHIDEVARLRNALAEQSTLVTELEDALAAAESRLGAAEHELVQLRRHLGEVEDADRQRRSRLAELEGTLIRLKAQASAQVQAHTTGAGADPEELRRLTTRVRDLEREADELRRRAQESERASTELRQRTQELAEAREGAESRAHQAEERVRSLEAAREEIDRQRAELAVEIGELGRAERGGVEIDERAQGRLAAAEAEVARLRTALERSEEQLWEAKRQLLMDRERIGGLEQQLEDARVRSRLSPEPTPNEATYQSLVARVLEELGTLENGLRAEVAQLTAIERTLTEWRLHGERAATSEITSSENS